MAQEKRRYELSPAISSIARNTAYLAGSQFLVVAARLTWMIVAARILGPDLYALLAYSQAWQLAFLPLALCGIGPALSYLLGPDRDGGTHYAAQALAIRLLTTLVAAAACVWLSRVITPDPRAPLLIAILTLVLVARALTTFSQTLFTAFEANQYTLRNEGLFTLVDLAIGVAILWGGGSLVMLVAARAAVAWVQAARALYLVHDKLLRLRTAWELKAWTPLLRLAAPALVITLAADWRFNGSLVLFRNLIPDNVLFGQFALAMRAVAIASILPLVLSRAAFPAMRRAVARGDGKELIFASAMQRAAIVAGTAAGLAGLALGEPLFEWLFGEAFKTAGRLAGLTLWCLVPLAAGTGYPEAFIARGRFNTLMLATAAGAAAMTLLMFALAPGYGAEGAIAAAFAGFCVAPAVIFALAWREGLADPLREFLRPAAAVAAAVLVYFLLASQSSLLALVVSLAVLAIASLGLGVISRREIESLSGR